MTICETACRRRLGELRNARAGVYHGSGTVTLALVCATLSAKGVIAGAELGSSSRDISI